MLSNEHSTTGDPVPSDIEARLAALEAAVASLRESAAGAELPSTPASHEGGVLWALEGLRSRAAEDGAVLYTGTVALPTGGRVEWQYGLPTSAVEELEWSEQSGRLQALGHPVRLRILREIFAGRTTAAALVEALDSGTSGQVYHHLKELTAGGWLTSNQRGVYEIPAPRVVPLLAILVAAGTPG